jgi:transcriptional regulator with XRE-family HTH domain
MLYNRSEGGANVFIERLKQLRNEKDMTQEDLAKILNVKQQTVGGWETGRTEPDLSTLGLMAEFFDVTSDYLLGRTNLRKPYVLKPGSPEYQRAMDKINKENWHEFKGSGIKVSAKDKDKFTEEEVNEIVKEVLEKIKERKED